MHLPECYLENNLFSEAGSYVAQFGLELSLYPEMTLNL